MLGFVWEIGGLGKVCDEEFWRGERELGRGESEMGEAIPDVLEEGWAVGRVVGAWNMDQHWR